MVLKSIVVAGGACALVAGVAVAGSAAGAAPSGPAVPAVAPVGDTVLASAPTPPPATPADTAAAQTLGRRRDLLCARVPRAITRTQNLEKRLAGDASTKGSLAYLQARIDKVEAAHQDQLVTVLQNRLTFRKQLASFLPQRLELLQTARRTVCAPPPAPSSSSSPSS
jgi:hypothetical protein